MILSPLRFLPFQVLLVAAGRVGKSVVHSALMKHEERIITGLEVALLLNFEGNGTKTEDRIMAGQNHNSELDKFHQFHQLIYDSVPP